MVSSESLVIRFSHDYQGEGEHVCPGAGGGVS
jgi:hypothetical protein